MRAVDPKAVSLNGAEARRQQSLKQRIWRFPITRIAVFVFLLWIFFDLLAIPIERIDRFDYQFWASPIAALAALAVMGKLEGIPLSGFGFKKPSVAPRDIVFGFLIGGATMSAIVGMMAADGWYHGHVVRFNGSLLSSLGTMLAIYLCIAIFEETVYRGYLFQTLERRWGADIAFAATMLTFGLMHLTINVPHAGTTLRMIGALSIAVEAGILFAAAYLLTRRLWMPIGIHWAWNFFEGPVFGTPVTGSSTVQTIFEGRVSGPSWATGGGFGPEASIPALLIGTALGLLFLWAVQVRKRRRSTHD